VTSDADTPGRRGSLGTNRLAAHSDGVFAIAATLLVLEMAVQPPGTLLQQVLDAWPGFVAYVVSFLTIGGTWLVHAALTDRLTRTAPVVLQLNLVLLLVVAFLSFPTKLVTDALHVPADERVDITIYGLTLLVIRLLTVALDVYPRREHLYSPQAEGEELQNVHRKQAIATTHRSGGGCLPVHLVAVYRCDPWSACDPRLGFVVPKPRDQVVKSLLTCPYCPGERWSVHPACLSGCREPDRRPRLATAVPPVHSVGQPTALVVRLPISTQEGSRGWS